MIGKILSNRYEVIEKIGEGGMSLVYKAMDQLLNRHVAIKVLKQEFNSDDELLVRFDKEAKAAASLQHPNIVNIFDVGTHEGDHFIVMELVSSSTLKDYIKGLDVYLKNKQIIHISMQVAEALQMAHDRGVIHRDIKPQNILITSNQVIKVADFGIARAVTSSTIVNTNEAIGSVHYASPEQSRGGFVDRRSDIYSFGILMYELATGRVPFEADTPIAIALKHLKEDVVPPSLVNIHLNPSLEKMILKCIHKEPARRYQSMYEIIDTLEKLEVNPDQEIVLDEAVEEDDMSRTMVMPDLSDYDLEDYPTNKSEAPMPKQTQAKKNYDSLNKDKPNPIGITMMVVLGLALSAAILFVIFAPRIWELNKSKSFELLDVVGMNATIASTELNNLGLYTEIIGKEYSDLDANMILSQSPGAGTVVKAGQRVQIVVSLGKRTVKMPNLRGQQVDQARVQMKNLNLEILSITEEYNDLPAGLIISQTPEANTDLSSGDVVTFVVSLGLETKNLLMPDLSGRSKEDAIRILQDIGLRYGAIDTAYSDDVPVDHVISQSVEQGKEIKEGSLVNMVLSLGSENPQETSAGSDEKVKSYYIPLLTDVDITIIKVVKVVDGVEETIYERIHRKEEESVQIDISGKGQMQLKFYRNDDLIEDIIVDFE